MLVGFKAQNHPQQVAKDDVDDRAVPDGEFWAINRRFNFTVDSAASVKNARLPRFWTKETNGLEQPWAGERIWCNPPFSSLRPWVEKAWREDRAQIIVMLIPANRTEQTFWQDLIEPRRDREGSPLRVEFLPNRLRFYRPGAAVVPANSRPPFGCCLLIWNWANAASETRRTGLPPSP